MDSFGGGGGYMQDGGNFASPMGESQEKKVCILIIVVANSSLNHVFQRYKIPLLDSKQMKTFISIIIPCLLVFLSRTIHSFQISSQWLCWYSLPNTSRGGIVIPN